ncbi:MAG TPA: hypothetical protein VFM02_01720 [Candidatus Paceibacterota bacterium]|nr:hypothetical protein [Candidatus Paceibacterota bacterium]
MDISSLLYSAGSILQTIIALLIALTVLFFFYGIVRFMFAAGNEESRKQGINLMIYGIIALFVMVSLWGLVFVLQDTFNVNQSVQVFPAPSV